MLGTDRNKKAFLPSLKLAESVLVHISSSGAIAQVSTSSREGRREQEQNSAMQSMGLVWKMLDSLQTTLDAVSQKLKFGSQDSLGQGSNGLFYKLFLGLFLVVIKGTRIL